MSYSMILAKTSTDFRAVIGPLEVVTSSDLRKRLGEKGFKDDYARKLIQREFSRSEDYWRSESIILSGGQRLFAHRKFYGRREFYSRVGEILKENRPGLARCLALLGVHGVLNRVQASKLLASPVQSNSKVRFPDYEEDVQALRELGVKVCQEKTAFEYLLGAQWKQGSHTDELAAKSITALRKESLLARILSERFRRQNLISWGGVELPSRERIAVNFNNQHFTAYGFCHLGPVLRREEEAGKSRSIPSPVLFDVHAGHCSEFHVHSFLTRAERATCRGKRRQSWMGVIAAREFDPSAWKLARTSGLLTVNFRQMFGDEALDAMARVEELLEAFQLDRPPEESDPAFLSFSQSLAELKTNPIVVDLRSVGFELLVGKALSATGYHSISLGQLVPFDRTSRDVDVSGNRGDEVCLIECKAYHAKKLITPDEVNKFYKETVPAYLTWYAKRMGTPPKSCRAEIWTTGKIGSEAKRQLERISVRSSITPKLLDTAAIQELLPRQIRERCILMMKSIAMTDDPGNSQTEDIEGSTD